MFDIDRQHVGAKARNTDGRKKKDRVCAVCGGANQREEKAALTDRSSLGVRESRARGR